MKTTALTADSITEAPTMENATTKTPPILEIAWTRYAQLNVSAIRRTNAYRRLRLWIGALGILATLFSIIYSQYFATQPSLLGSVIHIIFLSVPIISSLLAAIGSRTFANGDWLTTRAAAEEYLKEIYFFRTVLRGNPERRAYMEQRINEIQRQLYRGLGGEFAFRPYNGPVPPYYNPEYDNDPGFNDLNGDQYFKYRLEDQLRWHIREVNEYKRERSFLTVLVVIAGAAGTLLAAVGGVITVWVALTASIAAALIGWQQLRNLDVIIKNYSKVILELTSVYDHWTNLEPEERTDAEFYTMVRGTEDVLWAQNTEYIKAMQEALKDSDLEKEASLVNKVIKESVESAERTKEMMRESLAEAAHDVIQEAEEKFEENFKAAIGTLAEEAASEVVQKELEAMNKAASALVEKVKERASGLSSALADIAKEFAHVDIGRDTTKEELNAIMAKFPKTNDVKG